MVKLNSSGKKIMTETKNTLDLEKKKDEIFQILETVYDPEVPVLSVTDLGIIRDVQLKMAPAGAISVTIIITPTYTGCPAMDVIRTNIRLALFEHGYTNVDIKTILSPAWTTEWMSEKGKEKLK